MNNKFELVAGDRMDYVKAHIGAYNVQKEVSEVLAMLELFNELVDDTSAVNEVVRIRTGYTVLQLSNYALSMSA